MKTKDGVLYLGKREREALEIVKKHSLQDISFREGGSYNKQDKRSDSPDFPFDKVEARKAELGLDVIDFILEITK